MKLYTITATPIRSYKQLDETTQKSINHKQQTLKGINNVAVAYYPETVAEILATYNIDGFTIYKVQGFWQGNAEESFKIELALEGGFAIKAIAIELRDKYNQDAVMLTHPDGTVEFI